MSLYIRTMPGKFATFVITQIERQWSKHASSAFSHKRSNTQATLSTVQTRTNPVKEFPKLYDLHENCFLSQSVTSQQFVVLNEYDPAKNGMHSDPEKIIELQNFNNITLPLRESTNDFHGIMKDNIIWNKENIKDHFPKTMYTEKLFSNKAERANSVNLNSYQVENILSKGISCLTDGINTIQTPKKSFEDEGTRKPSKEQLQEVYNNLQNDISSVFVQSMNYRIYSKDIIFVNNIRGITTKGLLNYIKQVSLLRAMAHLKFAFVRMEILKMTLHVDDSTIKVRWRVIGVTALKVVSKLWKYKIWKIREGLKDEESWYDGFSEFYVDGNGKVYKHILHKIIPDLETELQVKAKTQIATKLVLCLGLKQLDMHAFSQYSEKQPVSY